MERWELEQKIVDLINTSGVGRGEATITLWRLADEYEAEMHFIETGSRKTLPSQE